MLQKVIIQESKLDIVAARLAELGHPTRLTIFKLLVKAGNDGISVGSIQQDIGIPGSTLSHHIAKMIKVGLIKQVRESRVLFCFPEFEALNEVINYLQEECCNAQQTK
ncbi:MAG: helix-turn-helix transcriptional regulator [Colwellia sp.]|nr:helix-turn-helix transcriptional regulator [Colwellia sp.]